jgi:hypothetical protein
MEPNRDTLANELLYIGKCEFRLVAQERVADREINLSVAWKFLPGGH